MNTEAQTDARARTQMDAQARAQELGQGRARPLRSAARYVVWVLKVALAVILIWAGALKVADPATFADQIAGYQMFPEFAPLAAATLPMTEILIGLVLLLAPSKSSWLSAAAIAAGAVFFVFLVGVTQVVIRGIDTSCGCFGKASAPVDLWSIARVLALLAGAAGLFLLSRSEKTPRRG